MNPAPSPYHQQVVGELHVQLFQQVQGAHRGRVFLAPIDVELSEYDIVQPDLVVIFREHEGIITPKKIKGTPDLVIEVLSESTERIDRGLKKDLYQRAAVPEYWIVDPGEHEVEQWVLEGRRHVSRGKHAHRLEASSRNDVVIDLAAVWNG